MLVSQAYGPGLTTGAYGEKLSIVAPACDPSPGEVETGRSLEPAGYLAWPDWQGAGQ